MLQLREYQLPAVDMFLARPDRRLFLAHEMGAGKSFVALAIAERIACARALFIVPAVVRPMWARLIATHFPDRVCGSITMGRGTKSGTKSALAARDRAYISPWQVVSYDLVNEVDLTPWDLVVVDEMHNLRNPLSVQSKAVRRLFEFNPGAAALGLSGTPIPNEARNLWGPLDTFFPGQFGEPTKTHDVSWSFQGKYCHKEINAHGTRYFGLRPEMRDKLAAALAPIMHRVVTSDFAAYLPPLFVEPLYVETAKWDVEKLTLNWVHERLADQTHVGVFTHLRETAHALAASLQRRWPRIPVIVITGADSTEARDKLLERSRAEPSCILVGTTHALKEGISLSHLKAALVVEWVTAMDQILQFLARFARQDSTTHAPTRVELVTGPNDESRLGTLRDRIEAFSSVFKAGRAENLALNAFQSRSMSDEEFQRELDAVVSGVSKRSKFKGFQDEEEDSEGDSDD